MKDSDHSVVRKVDMEKAYVHMNWSILDYKMRRIGFDNIWRNWMRKCYALHLFQLQSMGRQADYFKSSKG